MTTFKTTNDPLLRACLDHGFIRLVSYMQPAIRGYSLAEPTDMLMPVTHHSLQREWTGDLEIIRNARTSYNADFRAGQDADKDEKLLARMFREKHSSPFEAMVFTFEVQCPLFVIRQWHRHRTWSYNEVSARYTVLPDVFYIPAVEDITTQHATEKQMTTDEQNHEAEAIQHLIEKHGPECYKLYEALLEMGTPRELARTVLPLNIYTRMFATVDLHNLMHFMRLRIDKHAQRQIRVYALAVLDLIDGICPISAKLLRNEFNNNPSYKV